MQLGMQLKSKPGSLPFTEITSLNIGNPQQLQQKPLSYVRDVLTLCVNPSLAENKNLRFAPDLVARAKEYMSPGLGGTSSTGAYSDSQGLMLVREQVAKFLRERDGFEADVNNLFITDGASSGVALTMQSILRDSSTHKDGVLLPIPQYPLYSALLALFQAHTVPYYLDEANDWSVSRSALETALTKAKTDGVVTRALVVINPGNPTGQVLTQASMRELIDFCRTNQIVLLADEVYQNNTWIEGLKFTSFRKVAKEMNAISPDGSDKENGLQMISFHSTSKGYIGECGMRGGYFELLGFPQDVRREIYKLTSIALCSNILGQITVGLMVQPPKAGDSSFALFEKERNDILSSLQRRAKLMSARLNELSGVSCNHIQGALYAFPSITLSKKAIEAAAKASLAPDAFYCLDLLEQTGIVLVPGSGFGQKPGSFHFRTTILPPERTFEDVLTRFAAFHETFMKKYA